MSIYDPDGDPCSARRSARGHGPHRDVLPLLKLTDLRNLRTFTGTVESVHADGSMQITLHDSDTGQSATKTLRRSQLVGGASILSVPCPVTVKALSFESVEVNGWITPQTDTAETTLRYEDHCPHGIFGDGDEEEDPDD